MAPLATTNTARLFIDYTSRSIGHTLMLRFAAGTDPTAAAATANDLIPVLRPFMLTTDNFLAMRFAAFGSNLSFPVSFTALNGTSVVASDEVDPESFFFSWQARGNPSGRRLSISFYGSRGLLARAADNRYAYAEQVSLANIIDKLELLSEVGVSEPTIVTIAGDTPVWNQYTNVANSAYWQREQRG